MTREIKSGQRPRGFPPGRKTDVHKRETEKPQRRLPPGLAARFVAVRLISDVLERHRAFDDALAEEMKSAEADHMPPRDRGLARLIAATVLRRQGELGAVLQTFLDKPLPADKGRLWYILLSGAAQLLVLETPPHAAISLAVEQCRADRGARRFDRLANAVLRRVSEKGAGILAGLDGVKLNIPPWIWNRWVAAYGEDVARCIAEASLKEAPLDLSCKGDGAEWARRLGGVLLPSGSIRLVSAGRIEELPGYAEGQWWVQDAAAALPAKLLGNVEGVEIADLCAAPGGKALELAAAGARVTAVDQSAQRLERLNTNFARLGLSCETVAADAAVWAPGRTFDKVLLDAPCTATGTIRRHPDILHLKRESDVTALAQVQARLLETATRLVKPGGTLLYCTCSLEPEEGPDQIAATLDAHPELVRIPIEPGEAGIPAAWITADGDLRTLPFHSFESAGATGGLDGFYAARLRRNA